MDGEVDPYVDTMLATYCSYRHSILCPRVLNIACSFEPCALLQHRPQTRLILPGQVKKLDHLPQMIDTPKRFLLTYKQN